ncbi:MAG: PfkB family carbohydrate kinase [Bacteroidota bacterium]
MLELCTVGHITLDKIQTTRSVKYMPGGTAWYFSKALRNLNMEYLLVTAVGATEMNIVEDLQQEGINIISLPSEHTVYFENIYPENQDHREQNVHNTADPFTLENMPVIDAGIFHLGPLLNSDLTADLMIDLAKKGIVSLDIQGLLRFTENRKVYYKDWVDKCKVLPYISTLKANEYEMEILTGTTDVRQGAKMLADLGVKEVIITCGSKGSLIYTGDTFMNIPALVPEKTIDTTGCGDTYMAGYLYKKVKGAAPEECGLFGAAMATLKIQSFGPFHGTIADVEKLIATLPSVNPA